MANILQKQIIDLIKRSNEILILPSSPPDGDSIGAAIALYIALKKLQKDVTVVCKEVVPQLLKFLPNIKIIGNKMTSSKDFVISLELKGKEVENIKTETDGDKINIIISPKQGSFSEDDLTFNKGKSEFDLIITVDCAEVLQLGEIYENNIELFHQIPVINIDHHVSNTHFGKINYVDIMASSTTELLLPMLEELAKEEDEDIIDEDIATLLLTGIITDTGSFQNANTTPKSFAKAADLIAYGARQQEIIQHIYKTKQLSQLKLWGRVLSKIQTDEKYRIVWSIVSRQDFLDTDSSQEQTADIIDELMTNAPGAEIVLLVKEKTDGTISVSVRTTTPSIDASVFAEHFGGGGHTRAAGFRLMDIDLRNAEHKIIEYVKEFQKNRLGIVEEYDENEKEEKSKEESLPMIDVKTLLQKAQEAQKATDIIKKTKPSQKFTKKTNKKFKPSPLPLEEKKEEKPDQNVIYKFED